MQMHSSAAMLAWMSLLRAVDGERLLNEGGARGAYGAASGHWLLEASGREGEEGGGGEPVVVINYYHYHL